MGCAAAHPVLEYSFFAEDIATTVSDVNTLKVRADDIVTDFESLRDRLQRLGSLIDENDVNIREESVPHIPLMSLAVCVLSPFSEGLSVLLCSLDHLQHDLEGLITSVRSDAALRMVRISLLCVVGTSLLFFCPAVHSGCRLLFFVLFNMIVDSFHG